MIAAGTYQWSDANNWDNGVPATGDTVTVMGSIYSSTAIDIFVSILIKLEIILNIYSLSWVDLASSISLASLTFGGSNIHTLLSHLHNLTGKHIQLQGSGSTNPQITISGTFDFQGLFILIIKAILTSSGGSLKNLGLLLSGSTSFSSQTALEYNF